MEISILGNCEAQFPLSDKPISFSLLERTHPLMASSPFVMMTSSSALFLLVTFVFGSDDEILNCTQARLLLVQLLRNKETKKEITKFRNFPNVFKKSYSQDFHTEYEFFLKKNSQENFSQVFCFSSSKNRILFYENMHQDVLFGFVEHKENEPKHNSRQSRLELREPNHRDIRINSQAHLEKRKRKSKR